MLSWLLRQLNVTDECATHLDALGAKSQAAAVRAKLAPKKPKSDD